uniref:Phenoloxidase-activating factor 2 n=1 Tax=Corethrella appendiculata TaxID=1370023 RepID=U5ERE0_9DIPT
MVWKNIFVAFLVTSAVVKADDLEALINSVFNLTDPQGATTVATPIAPQPGPQPGPIVPAPIDVDPGVNAENHCSGECVQYYLCNDDKINDNGEGLIDIRFEGDEEETCVDYLESCCEKKNIVVEPIIPELPKLETIGCGARNPDGVGFRITGNNDGESEFAEFPWMVAVLKEEKTNDLLLNVYECGGSLIAPNVVLTSAHCVFEKKKDAFLVRAGEWDTQTKNELYGHQDRKVIDVIIHEQYNKGTLYNDVALLILQTPFDLAENVQTVCLPPQAHNFDLSRCYASGWGKNVFGREGKYQVILKKVHLPVVPHAKCQQALRTTRLGKRFNLHDSFLCAGGEPGKDTCRGDGGSPLVCPIAGAKERYYQAGIVAWGIGCGEDQIPGVYADVAKQRNWIDAKLKLKNVDPRHYTYLP